MRKILKPLVSRDSYEYNRSMATTKSEALAFNFNYPVMVVDGDDSIEAWDDAPMARDLADLEALLTMVESSTAILWGFDQTPFEVEL